MRPVATLLPLVWLLASSFDAPVADWYSPGFIATKSNEVISLRGHVRSSAQAERLRNLLSGLEREVGDVELQRHVILPAWWRTAIVDALGVLDRLYSGEVRIEADSLRIRGAVEDNVDIESAIAALEAVLPEDVRLQADISVVALSKLAAICDRAFASLDTGPLYFDRASARIRPENAGRLNRLATTLRRCPNLRLQISGHADAVGTRSGIQLASESRARAVKNYLSERGVAPDRLQTSGLGASVPAGNNATWEGRNRNRRVEFARLPAD